MNPQEFQEKLSEELRNINVSLVSIESINSALCIKWRFGEERVFTSAFIVNNEYLMTFPNTCIELMTKSVLMSLTEPDNLVGRIEPIKRRRKNAA